MEQVLVKIIGKVQGVGFRYSAFHQAKTLGLKGYVKNLSDGSVEALAQGKKALLEQFIDWCKKGPSNAKVDQLHTNWQEVIDSYENFEIL